MGMASRAKKKDDKVTRAPFNLTSRPVRRDDCIFLAEDLQLVDKEMTRDVCSIK